MTLKIKDKQFNKTKLKMKKHEFTINTTTTQVVTRIDAIESLIMNDEQFEKLTKKHLLKYELELTKLQSDALALKEYFIPLEYSYRYANTCKVLIKLINERINEEYKILLTFRNNVRDKMIKIEYDELITEIKAKLRTQL